MQLKVFQQTCSLKLSPQVKLYTEVSLLGLIGARVSVITVREQEHGTELDHVPTQHLLATEGKHVFSLRFLGWITQKPDNKNFVECCDHYTSNSSSFPLGCN